jgi:Tol biopolymer transport system component
MNLGSLVNTGGNDSGPCISPDGLSLYFNSDRVGGFGSLDIYVSQRLSVNDPWGPPQNLGADVNSSAPDNAPHLSPDGHRLYFQSTRPGGFGGADLYVARRRNKRDDFGWLAAENLGSEVNTSSNDGGPVYFEDDQTGAATLYFFSTRADVAGGVNIFASMLQADETWGDPQLVEELSSPFADSQPAISRNGLEFFVTSNRPGSFSSTVDIWVSTRDTTSAPWSVPVNAGPIINLASPYYQGRPSLSFDGTAMYFYAYRPDSYGAQDIYVSTRVKLRD